MGPLQKNPRRMYTAWPAQAEGCWLPQVHENCGHNVLAALCMRSLGSVPGSEEAARGPVYDAFARLRRVARRYCGSRWSLEQTAESYTGSLRSRYLRALTSLKEDGPLTARDHFLRCFLKAEKCDTRFKNPKPRMIFPRDPRYNLVLASWLKPFEHWLWGNLKSVGSRGVPKTRVVAKGLNPRQRANLIVRKFRAIRDCVVFEVDGKAFEAHVERWLLELEHSVYKTAYGKLGNSQGFSAEEYAHHSLARLLAKQLRLRGAAGGIRFERDGGRASGDFNTGMGNSLIMVAVVDAVMKLLNVQFDSLTDGDNALLFIRKCDLSHVTGRFGAEALRVSGFEMVLERPVDYLEGIRFGQSAPLQDESGWRMVRDWRKVLSQGTSSHAHLHEPRFIPSFLAGVAMCEHSLNAGVPILGEWSYRLREGCRAARPAAHCWRDYEALGVDLDGLAEPVLVPVAAITRLSFERAFGVSPEAQLAIEASLRWRCDISGWKPVPGLTSFGHTVYPLL